MVLWALKSAAGGEILVPKIPSYKITDVAEAIGPSCEKVIIGMRPGEKIHEEMITTSDSFSTIDLGNYYAILASDGMALETYRQSKLETKPVPEGFAYNSGTNPDFLTVKQIRDLIRLNIDSDFQPY